jgi:hypothetical protein
MRPRGSTSIHSVRCGRCTTRHKWEPHTAPRSISRAQSTGGVGRAPSWAPFTACRSYLTLTFVPSLSSSFTPPRFPVLGSGDGPLSVGFCPCLRPRCCRRRSWGGNRRWTLPGCSRITPGVRPRLAVALCSCAPPAPCVLAPTRVSAGSDPALRPRSIAGPPATGRPRGVTQRCGRPYSGTWMLKPDARLEALCRDIQGGHPARVVTQMSASRQCKRAAQRRRAAGVPARGGRPPHGLVQHAPGLARSWRYSIGSVWPGETHFARSRGRRGSWQAFLFFVTP